MPDKNQINSKHDCISEIILPIGDILFFACTYMRASAINSPLCVIK